MLRGTSALAGVFLCSVCLLAVSNQKEGRCFMEPIRRVRRLRNYTSEEQIDSRLYTPVSEVKKCPVSTLLCFAEEMEVLMGELKKSGLKSVPDLKISNELKRMAKKINNNKLPSTLPTNASCHQCEFFGEKNVTTFLDDLLVTLEKINELHCLKP